MSHPPRLSPRINRRVRKSPSSNTTLTLTRTCRGRTLAWRFGARGDPSALRSISEGSPALLPLAKCYLTQVADGKPHCAGFTSPWKACSVFVCAWCHRSPCVGCSRSNNLNETSNSTQVTWLLTQASSGRHLSPSAHFVRQLLET